MHTITNTNGFVCQNLTSERISQLLSVSIRNNISYNSSAMESQLGYLDDHVNIFQEENEENSTEEVIHNLYFVPFSNHARDDCNKPRQCFCQP